MMSVFVHNLIERGYMVCFKKNMEKGIIEIVTTDNDLGVVKFTDKLEVSEEVQVNMLNDVLIEFKKAGR